MKKLSELKLNQLSDAELNEREMNILRGSGTPGDCACGCIYAGTEGGSSSASNNAANNAAGLKTPGYGGGSSNYYGTECGYTIVNVTVTGCDAPAGCNSTRGC